MNAGESPRNQGLSVKGAPVRLRRRSRGLRKNAAAGRREARRSALWAGRSLPLEGQAMPQGRPMGAAFRAREFRRSATLCIEVAKGSKPTIWTEARRDVPRGNAPAHHNTRRNDDAPLQEDNHRSTTSWQNEPEDFGRLRLM